MDVRERSADRMSRVAAGAATEGLGAIVVGPSPDLAYLIGYDPPPFERPTVLVLRPDREPTLVVPQLERALAAVSGAGDLVELARVGPRALERARVREPAQAEQQRGQRLGGLVVQLARDPAALLLLHGDHLVQQQRADLLAVLQAEIRPTRMRCVTLPLSVLRMALNGGRRP